jgi:hypothetical protein
MRGVGGVREEPGLSLAFGLACTLTLGTAGACAPTAPQFVLAPVNEADSGTSHASSAPAPAAEGGAPSPALLCEATLRVGVVVPSPATCWLDQKVAHKTALLKYPCAGGPATAGFGVPFEGLADETGAVDLVAKTTYRWSGDGCNWESTQRIRGVLGEGELTYTYEEQPIDGSGCSPAYCKATTPVVVQRR